MAAKKYDGVIEAVRYLPDGKIHLARVYLRRGSIWTDRILLSRQELMDQIKAGKHFMVGKRIPYLAGTFDVTNPVQVKGINGKEVVYTSQPVEDCDQIEGAPLF